MDEEYFTIQLAEWWVEHAHAEPLSHSHRQLLYDACREIIRLNETIEGMKATSEREQWLEENYYSDGVRCDKCKSLLQQVRPGKWQCPECE